MLDKKYRFSTDPATGCLSEEDAKSYFSRIGFAIFAFGIGSSVAALLLSYLLVSIPFLASNMVIAAVSSHLLSLIAMYCVGLPAFIVMTKSLPSARPFRASMGAKDMLGAVCVSFAAMIIGNYISNIILLWMDALFGVIPQNPIDTIISPNDPAMIAVTVVFVVILAPIIEEIVFRKLFCEKLLPLGEGYAILISAATFGLIHENFYQVAYGFLVGALFALIYVKTGKLRYSIILHMIINLLGAVVGPLLLSFLDVDAINALLEQVQMGNTVDMSDPSLTPLFAVGLYELVLIALAAVGVYLFYKAKSKGALSLDAGLLQPPKKGRAANLLCNVGVAAAITYFTVAMVISLLPV